MSFQASTGYGRAANAVLTTSQLTAGTKLKTTTKVGLWDESKYSNRTHFEWPGENPPKEPEGLPPLTQADELIGGDYLPVGTIVTVETILYHSSAYQCIRSSVELPTSTGAPQTQTGFLYTTHQGNDQVVLYLPQPQPGPGPQPQPPEPPASQPGDVQIEVHAGQTVVVEVKSTTTTPSSSGGELGSPFQAAGLYTPGERREMAEGRVTGTPLDREVAELCGVQVGDILFRLGSRLLAMLIGEPVTHGGIYLGNGLIHDMVGFGNRSVRLVEYYSEADEPSVVRVVRFIGPLHGTLVARLISNINARAVTRPTGSKPWNLFSSANDYETATCLEYSHEQFLQAIRMTGQDPALAAADRSELAKTYFASGGAEPQALIAPRTLPLFPLFSSFQRLSFTAGATLLADDVDPAVFENRWEGSEESITSFTYNSFVNASRFFQPVDVPAGNSERISGIIQRFKKQVLPIGPSVSINVTVPFDRTVTRQTGIAWAKHGSGHSYLVQMSVVNSSYPQLQPQQIFFHTFVDNDLKDRAIARALLHQPRGIQSLPWDTISGIPIAPPPTAAQR